MAKRLECRPPSSRRFSEHSSEEPEGGCVRRTWIRSGWVWFWFIFFNLRIWQDALSNRYILHLYVNRCIHSRWILFERFLKMPNLRWGGGVYLPVCLCSWEHENSKTQHAEVWNLVYEFPFYARVYSVIKCTKFRRRGPICFILIGNHGVSLPKSPFNRFQ